MNKRFISGVILFSGFIMAVSSQPHNMNNSGRMPMNLSGARNQPQNGRFSSERGNPPPQNFAMPEAATYLDAAVVVDGFENNKIDSQNVESNEKDKSVLLVTEGKSASASGSVFSKTGGESSNSGQSGFFGLNAAVVSEKGSQLKLTDVTVSTSAENSNALFSTGRRSTIQAENIKISTEKDFSKGLGATFGGEISADNVEIQTTGTKSAAISADTQNANISVNGGSAKTSGKDSPVIYSSSGKISVEKLTGEASDSEIAVVEGQNSLTIEGSSLKGAGEAGIKLSRGANGAPFAESVFKAEDSVLETASSGPFFSVNNTSAQIKIEGTQIIYSGEVLLSAVTDSNPFDMSERPAPPSSDGERRGDGERKGKNEEKREGNPDFKIGSVIDFNSESQKLSGEIRADKMSLVNLKFNKETEFTGAINKENEGTVNLSLAKNASITLTGDSYINGFLFADDKFSNIASGGFNLYYNKTAKENASLRGKSYDLPGGGKLIGIDMEEKIVKTDRKPEPASSPRGGRGPGRMMF